MKELKTLKDMSFRESPQLGETFEPVRKVHNKKKEWINHEDLRKEAMRWIMSKECMKFKSTWDSKLFSNYDQSMGAFRMLEYFFNITCNDLDVFSEESE